MPLVAPQILTIDFQQVECIQERIARAQAADRGAQLVEVRHAVWSAHHALAVERHRLHQQLDQCLNDQPAKGCLNIVLSRTKVLLFRSSRNRHKWIAGIHSLGTSMFVSDEEAAAMYARWCRKWYGVNAKSVVKSKIRTLMAKRDRKGVSAWQQVADALEHQTAEV